jgi:N,N'-diacetyllegionaminate synthase
MSRTYIIAEAGVNHNGNFDTAKYMILEAKKAGADAVKFQTFVSKNLVSSYASKADYQKKSTSMTETQLEMLEKLELSYEQFRLLHAYSKEIGIDFVSTPFDLDSIDFLLTLSMPFWKIPSGEITNKPYLMKIEQTKIPIILSTGMSTMTEISEALEIFHEYERCNISLLHCNTEYPTPYEDVNLHAMGTLQKTFHVNIGYSDHTQGVEVPIAAVALGATIIEKHFTLDKNMSGPDHMASLDIKELADMVQSIRIVEKALGVDEKKPTMSEIKNINVARKSIVAKKDIKKNEIYTESNITTKRPGDGISPMKWFEILGKTAKRDFKVDEKIDI